MTGSCMQPSLPCEASTLPSTFFRFFNSKEKKNSLGLSFSYFSHLRVVEETNLIKLNKLKILQIWKEERLSVLFSKLRSRLGLRHPFFLVDDDVQRTLFLELWWSKNTCLSPISDDVRMFYHWKWDGMMPNHKGSVCFLISAVPGSIWLLVKVKPQNKSHDCSVLK